MEVTSNNDILALSLSLTKIFGEYLYLYTWKLYLFRSWNILILTLILLFIIINIYQVESDMYIKSMESVISIVHMLLKYIFYCYNKPNLEKLLKLKTKFWNTTDKIDDSSSERIFKNLNIIQYSAMMIGLSVGVMYALRPFFNQSSRFIFDSGFIADSLILETIVLFCQYYFLIFWVPVTLGYDAVYFCFSTHVIIQARMLKKKLFNWGISSEDRIDEIYRCISHHQLLLAIFVKMQGMYFWMLLFHYIVTLITGCSQLYVILISNTGIPDLVGTLIYITGMLVQFGYYTFPAEEVVFELRSISTAVYNSPWYEQKVEVRKLFLTIMLVSQEQKYLSAGGMFDVNIDAFGSVIRKAFSFYTILHNIFSN